MSGLEPMTEVGVYYCTAHHGVANEDDLRCDFALDECDECEGSGVDSDGDDCGVCGGTGEPTDCRLVQCSIPTREVDR